MLIQCPECGLQASDKAVSCPHCGLPFQSNSTKPRPYRKSNKRRRLPNGFGQITEIKGRNLRNPFRAMVTVGKDETGHPICELLKPVAYFPTYNDAYTALVNYNKNPYDPNLAMTVAELYDKWSDGYFKTLKRDSSVRTITAAWNYCSTIYNMKVVDVRARHIKGCMEEGKTIVKGKECFASPSIKTKIKSLFNLMLDYAVEYEIVERNYSRAFNISETILKENEKDRKGHIPFTDDEMATLWENIYKVPFVDAVLIQCYSGWRPQELGLLRLDDVNINNWTFTGGMKTEAGTDRTIPIHSKIRPLVLKRYDEAKALNSEYLINCDGVKSCETGLQLTYFKYRHRFIAIRDKLRLNPEHRNHDPRVQFVTMAKRCGVDEYAIKYIVGHAITDITEKVYTKREIEWLKTEIEKIK